MNHRERGVNASERGVNRGLAAYAGAVTAQREREPTPADPAPQDTHAAAGLVAPLVLGLLPVAPTPGELHAELARIGIHASSDTVDDWLGWLSELGLVRIGGHASGPGGGQAQYVATTLGQRVAGAGLAGRPELVPGLRELEALRGDLLATIAHELRTPLTAVRTSIGLLLDPGLDPSPEERQRLLITIGRSTDRMQRLLEDLLDLARFRAGKIRLARRRIDARDLAQDALMPIEPLAAMREQRLEMTLPDQPVMIDADRRRLEQALLNLLSNASKFGPPGSVVGLALDGAEGNARFEVRDSGPGISLEDQARLFERFFVGEGDRAGGVGLGLPTALAIAQAHGGGIEVDSVPGAGSRFSLVVPLARARKPRRAAPQHRTNR
jgi:signal transduction histidine kinase